MANRAECPEYLYLLSGLPRRNNRVAADRPPGHPRPPLLGV